MRRMCLIFAAAVSLAVLPVAACGHGPSGPMPDPDMPMEQAAADTLSR